MDGGRPNRDDARRLMQAVPFHREPDDRQYDDADDRQHSGQLGSQASSSIEVRKAMRPR